MKKTILSLLCALALLACCLPAFAEEETLYEADGFRYLLLEDGSAVLVEYISDATSRRQPDAAIKSVVINKRIDRHPIVDLRQNPFYVPEEDFTQMIAPAVMIGHQTLDTVDGVLFVIASHKLSAYPVFLEPDLYEVPADTLIIGAYAFACNPHLAKIVLPEGLTAIETGAFRNCASLVSVNIPASVTEIAADAFEGCSAELNLTVAAGSYAEAFCTENGIAFTSK